MIGAVGECSKSFVNVKKNLLLRCTYLHQNWQETLTDTIEKSYRCPVPSTPVLPTRIPKNVYHEQEDVDVVKFSWKGLGKTS